MDKKTSEYYNKNFKILLIFLVIVAIAVILCFCGTMLYYQQSMSVLKVEYRGLDNNVVVQTYSKGEKVNFPKIPNKYGYEFLGWTLDEDAKFWVSSEMVIDKELTLHAQWKKKVFEINYGDLSYNIDYNCSFLIENDSLIFVDNIGKVVKLNKTAKDGYEFTGWELSDGSFTTDKIEILSLDSFSSNKLLLKEKYIAKQASFLISENNNYLISNLSHKESITVGETLTFDVVLDESVNRSNINVVASSGMINKYRKNNVYSVEVANFTRDFEVYIDNVDINQYNVTIINDGNVENKAIKYGEKVILPKYSKLGYSLVGFRGTNGKIYTEDFVVTSDIVMEACYEVNTYSITMPKKNGKYLIKYEDEYLMNNIVYKNYMDSIEFEVELASAYSDSNINVYTIINGCRVDLEKIDNKYVLNSIGNNIIIYIDNIEVNKYLLIVDGVDYGRFCYGSLVSVQDDCIRILDNINATETNIVMLFDDNNFGGWIVNNEKLLIDSSIQYLAKDNKIIINGVYSINL